MLEQIVCPQQGRVGHYQQPRLLHVDGEELGVEGVGGIKLLGTLAVNGSILLLQTLVNSVHLLGYSMCEGDGDEKRPQCCSCQAIFKTYQGIAGLGCV